MIFYISTCMSTCKFIRERYIMSIFASFDTTREEHTLWCNHLLLSRVFFHLPRSKLGKISEEKPLINIGRCGTTYQSPDKTYDLFKIFSFYWISIPIKQEEEIRNRQNPVMDIPIYTVDAFTKVPFEGNPAAICLVDPEHVICLLK